MSDYISDEDFAPTVPCHIKTLQRWCRNSMKTPKERDKKMPPVVCRRIGRKWQINAEATQKAMSIALGNSAARDIALTKSR